LHYWSVVVVVVAAAGGGVVVCEEGVEVGKPLPPLSLYHRELFLLSNPQ
jgi:hypothetical protein